MDAREYGERTGWAHGAPHMPDSAPEPPPVPPPRGWRTRTFVLAPVVGFAAGWAIWPGHHGEPVGMALLFGAVAAGKRGWRVKRGRDHHGERAEIPRT